jgi:hypothetical protein
MRENTFIPYLGSHEADEILSHPGATGQYALPFLSTNGATPASALQPFSTALLQHALLGVDLHFSLDRDGDPVTVFAEDDLPGDLLCWYLIAGEHKDIFRLLCTVDPTIPQSKWRSALLAINEFQGTCRAGRGYLEIKDGQAEARVYFEALLDCAEGVTEASLQRFIMLNLYAAHLFFMKLSRQKLLHPARPRTRSKTTRKQEVFQNK